VRARKAAPTRSKLDAAFHRVPPCSVSYWSKIYRVAAAEASPRPFPQKSRHVKQVSSVGGKPGVKPDPPRAPTGGAQIVDFSSKSDDEGTPERPDKTIS